MLTPFLFVHWLLVADCLWNERVLQVLDLSCSLCQATVAGNTLAHSSLGNFPLLPAIGSLHVTLSLPPTSSASLGDLILDLTSQIGP